MDLHRLAGRRAVTDRIAGTVGGDICRGDDARCARFEFEHRSREPEKAAKALLIFVRSGAALAILLAALPATGMPPRCREVPAADALRRLEVWGREWAASRGPIRARATRRVAVLTGGDAILEALFLVALDRARGQVGTPTQRPRWVLCVGEETEIQRGG